MNVLLIADDLVTFETFERHLRSLGDGVNSCRDAETALEACRRSFYPLIVLDLGLPTMDGIEFCRRLRDLPQGDESLILALAGPEQAEPLQAAFDAGVDEFLTTPVSPELLRIRFTILARRFERLTQQKQAEKLLAKTQEDLQQAHEELRQSQQHLEELIETRANELQNSTRHLQQEMSDRKRADRALQTSEDQYRLLAENVADGIGIIQNGTLVFVNDALTAMLGYTAQELIGTDVLDLLHDEYKAAFRKRFHDLMEGGGAQDWQAVYRTRDGREIWTELHYRAIEWEGKPAFLATMRDINARKLREQAMEKEREHLRKENVQLRSARKDRSRFGDLIGKSRVMQEVYAQIVTAAAVEANVLISGESGTGKELASLTIHRLSRRKTQKFVAVNCGAIPENLFEREFFGHHKGAFTGAEKDTPGLFDRANKGTLFLDEIGELPAAMQVKLLRVLETGEYTPIGQNRPRQVDVRLIAATNKHLESLVKQGLMRDDFFYRIYVLDISMPPLRQHPEDIPLLIDHFLQQHYDANTEPRPTIPEQIIETLSQHNWPGNVRELYNVLHRYLQEHHLSLSSNLQTAPMKNDETSASEFMLHGLTFREAIEAYEKRLIAAALKQSHNNTANAARLLGMPLRTLYRKIEKYQLL